MHLKDLIRKYKEIEPDTDWCQENKARITEYYQKNFKTAPERHIFAPVSTILLLVVIIFITSFGLVNASGNSLPGDFLYPLKKISEKTKYALTLNPSKRIVFKAEILDSRLDEVKILGEMVKKGEGDKSSFLKKAAQDFQGELNNLKKEIAEGINLEIKETKADEILLTQADLPIGDEKEIIAYFGKTEEIEKILAETRELLSQKNLEVALNCLENISKTTTTTEEIIEKTEEKENETDEINATSSSAVKPKQKIGTKDMTGTGPKVSGEMIKYPSSPDFETYLKKE